MADIMMKIQQDKMVLIFIIVNVFGSLNMQIDAMFPIKSAGVIVFSFRPPVKMLLANIHWHSVNRILFYTFQMFFHQ